MIILKFGSESSDSIRLWRLKASKIITKSFGFWRVSAIFPADCFGELAHPTDRVRARERIRIKIRFSGMEKLNGTGPRFCLINGGIYKRILDIFHAWK